LAAVVAAAAIRGAPAAVAFGDPSPVADGLEGFGWRQNRPAILPFSTPCLIFWRIDLASSRMASVVGRCSELASMNYRSRSGSTRGRTIKLGSDPRRHPGRIVEAGLHLPRFRHERAGGEHERLE
jgi:hypothetical protein